MSRCEVRESLENDGWQTPQTYCKCFADPGDFPAVYLFLVIPNEHIGLRDAPSLVGYVGMSTRLVQRWSGHQILREMEAALGDDYIQKWFLRCAPEILRDTEKRLIQRFDPPWNISGRRRGIQ